MRQKDPKDPKAPLATGKNRGKPSSTPRPSNNSGSGTTQNGSRKTLRLSSSSFRSSTPSAWHRSTSPVAVYGQPSPYPRHFRLELPGRHASTSPTPRTAIPASHRSASVSPRFEDSLRNYAPPQQPLTASGVPVRRPQWLVGRASGSFGSSNGNNTNQAIGRSPSKRSPTPLRHSNTPFGASNRSASATPVRYPFPSPVNPDFSLLNNSIYSPRPNMAPPVSPDQQDYHPRAILSPRRRSDSADPPPKQSKIIKKGSAATQISRWPSDSAPAVLRLPTMTEPEKRQRESGWHGRVGGSPQRPGQSPAPVRQRPPVAQNTPRTRASTLRTDTPPRVQRGDSIKKQPPRATPPLKESPSVNTLADAIALPNTPSTPQLTPDRCAVTPPSLELDPQPAKQDSTAKHAPVAATLTTAAISVAAAPAPTPTDWFDAAAVVTAITTAQTLNPETPPASSLGRANTGDSQTFVDLDQSQRKNTPPELHLNPTDEAAPPTSWFEGMSAAAQTPSSGSDRNSEKEHSPEPQPNPPPPLPESSSKQPSTATSTPKVSSSKDSSSEPEPAGPPPAPTPQQTVLSTPQDQHLPPRSTQVDSLPGGQPTRTPSNLSLSQATAAERPRDTGVAFQPASRSGSPSVQEEEPPETVTNIQDFIDASNRCSNRRSGVTSITPGQLDALAAGKPDPSTGSRLRNDQTSPHKKTSTSVCFSAQISQHQADDTPEPVLGSSPRKYPPGAAVIRVPPRPSTTPFEQRHQGKGHAPAAAASTKFCRTK